MIRLEDYWDGRDVAYAAELTEEIRKNAEVTVERVNRLLDRADTRLHHDVSSGWRPASINAAANGSSKTSKHLTGQAVDIADADRFLADWCVANLEVLEELELWMEDPRWTPRWIHLQTVPPKSNRRVYIPSLAKPLDPDYPVTWA